MERGNEKLVSYEFWAVGINCCEPEDPDFSYALILMFLVFTTFSLHVIYQRTCEGPPALLWQESHDSRAKSDPGRINCHVIRW